MSSKREAGGSPGKAVAAAAKMTSKDVRYPQMQCPCLAHLLLLLLLVVCCCQHSFYSRLEYKRMKHIGVCEPQLGSQVVVEPQRSRRCCLVGRLCRIVAQGRMRTAAAAAASIIHTLHRPWGPADDCDRASTPAMHCRIRAQLRKLSLPFHSALQTPAV